MGDSCFSYLMSSVILLVLGLSKVEGACKIFRYLDCIKDQTLVGYVLKSTPVPVPALALCQIQCFDEDQCVSYNLGPVEGVTRSCELNSADHWMNNSALIPKVGSEFCPIDNQCSTNPCQGNKPQCFPDFLRETHSCQEGIWSIWGSWTYCNCPTAKRTRKCVSKSVQNPNCGPGETEQVGDCPPSSPVSCSSALGMEDGRIQDSQITSSSEHSYSYCRASFGRLHRQYTPSVKHDGSWCAAVNAPGVYLQVDLVTPMTVTRIATQGRHIDSTAVQYVTSYTIYYNAGSQWVLFTGFEGCPGKIFPANNDTTSVVTNEISPAIVARYVRVYPVTYSGHMSMRMELYGCSLT